MASKRVLAIAGAFTTVGLASIIGLASVSAESQNSPTGLVDKIAQRFNLNKSDVQKVFDENRSEHQAARQQHYEYRLSQAVKDGKLTEDQKTKLLDKLNELQSREEDLEDKTSQQRYQNIEQDHDALKQWAQDNNIPQRYLPGSMHGSRPMGIHGDTDQTNQ